MKLLKFVNSDAPQTLTGAHLSTHSLVLKSGKPSGSPAKVWKITPDHTETTAAMQGGYWLIDDDGKPICALNDILLAIPDTKALTCSSTPRGVTQQELDGVDLRSKLGRQLERTRAEYGSTYKTASKSARLLMNAEEVTAKKHESMKRNREVVAEAIEAGETLAQPATKRTRK